MQHTFEESHTKFKNLSFDKKVICSIIFCNQMTDGYRIFANLTKGGNYELLLKYLLNAEESFFDNPSAFAFQEIDLNEIYDLSPNSDDFNTEWSTYAQDACSAIYYLVEAIYTKDSKDIDGIPQKFIGVIDTIIHSKYYFLGISPVEHSKLINADELMQKELRLMNEIIDIISKLEFITQTNLRDLIQSLPTIPFEMIPLK